MDWVLRRYNEGEIQCPPEMGGYFDHFFFTDFDTHHEPEAVSKTAVRSWKLDEVLIPFGHVLKGSTRYHVCKVVILFRKHVQDTQDTVVVEDGQHTARRDIVPQKVSPDTRERLGLRLEDVAEGEAPLPRASEPSQGSRPRQVTRKPVAQKKRQQIEKSDRELRKKRKV